MRAWNIRANWSNRAAGVLGVALALALMAPTAAVAETAREVAGTGPAGAAGPTTVTLDGRPVDMDVEQLWKEASSCIVQDSVMECYRTLEEGEAAHAHVDGLEMLAASASCSVRLFRGTGYGGQQLVLTGAGMWHNLSWYGFNNATSSYQIGACLAIFRDGSSGTGWTYPGVTSAWWWDSSMVSGWNNRVSSVYFGP